MEDIAKRAWAEISLSALEHNYNELRAKLPENCRFLGVVKADAYGHGAITISRELERLGADYLAVACLDEAIALRSEGVGLPILILGVTPASYAPLLASYGLTQTVNSLDMARSLDRALDGKSLKVHFKVDSGMGRLGFSPEEAAEGITQALKLPNLEAEGIFTHFAVSDVYGDPFTQRQFDLFTKTVSSIESASAHRFEIRHCANSGAVINYPEMCLDMVRPGIALYGHYPAAERGGLDLSPVMQLKARVSAIHTRHPGETISYGRTYCVAERPMRVAVVGIGYADGVQRALSDKMQVLINRCRARQIGRICMDMCMVDVTDIPCEVGDVVTVFGTDGHESVSVDELARQAGTINYELLATLGRRVPRVYLH